MNGSGEPTYRNRMLQVLLYIEEHLDDDLAREALARISHFSPYHFHRIFTSFTGEPLHKYIRRLRLERAAGRLMRGEQSIIGVAMEAGFDSHEAFTRIFKKTYGLTPVELRSFAVGGKPVVLHTSPIHILSEQGDCEMEVRLETLSPKRIAFIRHVGPYMDMGSVFGRLCAWAGPRGLLGPATECVGIYHDDPDVTPPEKLRSDAAIIVGPSVQGEGEVRIGELAGGEYAIARHKGPYSKLIESYRWLYGQWLSSSGREPANCPCFEKYINDPRSTPEDQLLTDIHLPLR